MSDMEILGFDVENVEIVAVLTVLGWIVTFFLIRFWQSKVPNVNFLTYGIVTAILTPVIVVFIIKWQMNK